MKKYAYKSCFNQQQQVLMMSFHEKQSKIFFTQFSVEIDIIAEKQLQIYNKLIIVKINFGTLFGRKGNHLNHNIIHKIFFSDAAHIRKTFRYNLCCNDTCKNRRRQHILLHFCTRVASNRLCLNKAIWVLLDMISMYFGCYSSLFRVAYCFLIQSIVQRKYQIFSSKWKQAKLVFLKIFMK